MPKAISEPIRVIVCDDEAELCHILEVGLSRLGCSVRVAGSAGQLDRLLEEQPADVLVLDVGLPGEDGFAIAHRIRLARPGLGIVMLTARGALEDRLEALQVGADVYFVKPVDLQELAFTLRNLHRRVAPAPAAPEVEGGYLLHPVQSTLALPTGERVALTHTELRILRALARTPGEVVDRVELLGVLDESSDLAAIQRLEAHISRLRGKVRRAAPAHPLPLHARHGLGYAFLAAIRILP